MKTKVYAHKDNSAIFTCPVCGNVKRKRVSQVMNMSRAVKIRCSCQCGCKYSAFLERRQRARKPVNLSGKFLNSGGKGAGIMTVKDVSQYGIGMKISSNYALQIGDKLSIEFTLNDRLRSSIKRDVLVRNRSRLNVGTEFCSTDHYDKLGAFLFYS